MPSERIGGATVVAPASGPVGAGSRSLRAGLPPAAGVKRVGGAPLLQPGVAPPPDYYRNNLLRVLEHVCGQCADLLGPQEADFIDRLGAVSRNAQRLYARLLSRKVPRIRLDRLAYAEIEDVQAAVEELAAAALVELGADAPTEDLLTLFTKKELSILFGLRAPTKKALLDGILQRYAGSAVRERLMELSDWLCLADGHCLDHVQLLFFGASAVGGLRADLTTFVLEDLGAARFEDYAISPDRRLFHDRSELRRYLALRDLNDLSHRVSEHVGLADAVLVALANVPEAVTRLEKRLSDRTLNRLGRWFERTGRHRDALHCYVRSTSHPARERRVRILSRFGEERAAATLLDEIARDPQCPEEKDFAARFGKRRAHGMLPVTAVPLKEGTQESVESRALAWFKASGGEGWHLENHLPLGLAGLAFWDVIFAPVDGVFLNPYQAGPIDLFWEDFTAQRRDELARAKAVLEEPQQFSRVLNTTLEAKRGIVNRLVNWRHLDANRLGRILETVPHRVLFPLACHVIDNLRMARTGFPDLLILYGADDYEFVEVKGPNDQLQPAQRVWFKYFRENAFNARILKFKVPKPGGHHRQ